MNISTKPSGKEDLSILPVLEKSTLKMGKRVERFENKEGKMMLVQGTHDKLLVSVKKDDDSFDEILIDNRVKNNIEPVKTVMTVTESEVNLEEIVSEEKNNEVVSEEPLDDDVDGSALAGTDASAEPSTSKTEQATTKEELMKNSKAVLMELVEKKLNGEVVKGLKRKNKSQLVELILG